MNQKDLNATSCVLLMMEFMNQKDLDVTSCLLLVMELMNQKDLDVIAFVLLMVELMNQSSVVHFPQELHSSYFSVPFMCRPYHGLPPPKPKD